MNADNWIGYYRVYWDISHAIVQTIWKLASECSSTFTTISNCCWCFLKSALHRNLFPKSAVRDKLSANLQRKMKSSYKTRYVLLRSHVIKYLSEHFLKKKMLMFLEARDKILTKFSNVRSGASDVLLISFKKKEFPLNMVMKFLYYFLIYFIWKPSNFWICYLRNSRKFS